MNWTENQRLAIDKGVCDTLVSAAAGSGKTATLTERVISSICREEDPRDISRLLIVTFTNKAADELKAKIRKKLREKALEKPSDPHIRRQLLCVSGAKISTIHSFYGRLVRDNLKILGLPSGLRTADEGEISLLSRNIMDDTIESFYSGPVGDGLDLEDADGFFEALSGIKTDEKLADVLLGLYSEISSYPEHVDYPLKAAELYGRAARDFSDSVYMEKMRKKCAEAEYFIHAYEDIEGRFEFDEVFLAKYAPATEARIAFLKRLLALSKTGKYEEIRAFISQYRSLPKLLPVRGEADFKEPTKACNDELNAFIKSLSELFAFDGDDVASIMEQNEYNCKCIHRVLKRFYNSLRDEKLRLGIAGFDDLERYAYNLLCLENGDPTPLALTYGEEFDEIYIDEYQDTNLLQDRMFAALSKNNRFMVGDVKQSIYSFRGAVPEIFSEYRQRFAKGEGECIYLSNNFRCSKEVVDFTNLVFSRLLPASGGVDYEKADELVFTKPCPVSLPPAPVRLITVGEDEDGRIPVFEALCREINGYLDTALTDTGKKVGYGDITVLCRKKEDCRAVERALSYYSVPVYNAAHQSFFDSPEVLLAVAVLSCVDNPMRDVHLAAAMKSPIFGFSLSELANIRKRDEKMPLYVAVCAASDEGDEKCREFIERLNYLRYRAKSTETDKFIRFLYRETKIESLIYHPEDGEGERDRAANLRLLYDIARDFESGSFKGLSGFISYLNDMIYRNTRIDAAHGDDASLGKVTVQTIHNSKGLEYPVCILFGAETQFSRKHTQAPLACHRELGVAASTLNPVTGAVRKGPAHRIIMSEMNRAITREEIRLLYVALTRARDHLCIIGVDKACKQSRDCTSYSVYKDMSHLALIKSALSDVTHPSFVREHITSVTAKKREQSPFVYAEGDVLEALKERVFFEYPYKTAVDMPRKISVSRLFPGVLDPEDRAIPSLSEETPVIREPSFMSDCAFESKDRGIATHLFMQFCDLSKSRLAPRDEANRLFHEGFIREDDVPLMYFDEIEGFFKSDIYGSMLDTMEKGRLFCREYRFNVSLPALEFTLDPETARALEGEKLLVQGVVDCFFENEDGTLTVLDYKTDRIRKSGIEDFRKRHMLQISYYKAALERLTKKRVSRTVLYSFCLGCEIEV